MSATIGQFSFTATIVWNDRGGRNELSVTSNHSYDAALEGVWRIARGMGWTPPKWWQWWRWRDSRPPQGGAS